MRLALAVAVLTVLTVFIVALAWAGTWIARHEPPETPAGDDAGHRGRAARGHVGNADV